MQDNFGPAAGTEPASPPQDVRTLPYAGPPRPDEPPELRTAVTRYDVAVVAMRMLGIYVLLQGGVGLAWAIVTVGEYISRGSGNLLMSLFALLPLAVCVTVGVFFLKTAPRLARRMLPPTAGAGGAGAEPVPGSLSLQAIAFSVAGIVIAAQALPRFCYLLVATVRNVGNVYDVPDHGGEFLRVLIEPGLEIVIGAFLFVGSKRLARFWHRIRRPEFEPPTRAGEP